MADDWGVPTPAPEFDPLDRPGVSFIEVAEDPRFLYDPLTDCYVGEGLAFTSELVQLAGSPGAVAALAALNPSLRVLLTDAANVAGPPAQFAYRIVSVMLDKDGADG